MSSEHVLFLRMLCLLAGYVFGGFSCADVAARCVAGTPLRFIGNGSAEAENIRRHLGRGAQIGVVVGDVLKTWLACWFCYKLAAPELEYAAMLYGGLGVLAGHSWPVIRTAGGARGAVVVCAWVAASLPVSGMLCVLAGAVVKAGTGNRALAIALIPALAVPVAWLQYGLGSAGLMLTATVITLWQYRAELTALRADRPRHITWRGPFTR